MSCSEGKMVLANRKIIQKNISLNALCLNIVRGIFFNQNLFIEYPSRTTAWS